jgi:glucoamylase
VRYGVRSAEDPLIVDSLRVVDAVLKVETPSGPCWRRYNHDGYGQGPDGGPFTGSGQGRAWPLLTGERGHYELAAGGDARKYLLAMEAFASDCGLLPEQVWDEADLPDAGMSFGGPTGSATPLAWAHAEYIKLLRSISDGRAFDLVPEVYERYVTRGNQQRIEVWKPNRRVRSVERGSTFRIQAPRPFRLRWSLDNWETAIDSEASATALGIHYTDLDLPEDQVLAVRFTFYWTDTSEWEGSDSEVRIE